MPMRGVVIASDGPAVHHSPGVSSPINILHRSLHHPLLQSVIAVREVEAQSGIKSVVPHLSTEVEGQQIGLHGKEKRRQDFCFDDGI